MRSAATVPESRKRGAPAAQRLRPAVAQARVGAIMIGGAVGTLARAGVAEALPHTPTEWPWATFLVNLLGAFILGWLLTRLAEPPARGGGRPEPLLASVRRHRVLRRAHDVLDVPDRDLPVRRRRADRA